MLNNPRRSARNHKSGIWNVRTVGIVDNSRKLDTFLSSDRLNNDTTKLRHNYMKRSFRLSMTVSQGIKKLGDEAIHSVAKEMIKMCDMKVITGVKLEDLTKDQISRIITSSMFLKEKFTADGLFEKLKARLVAGGHLQGREIYDKGTSPTVSTSSVFLLAALAASNNRAVACIGFPGAFLNVDMPEVGKYVVLMRLNKFLTSVLIRIDPTYSTYVQNNGTCVVRLKKALYGCVKSAAMWCNRLSTDLESLGYKKKTGHMCI